MNRFPVMAHAFAEFLIHFDFDHDINLTHKGYQAIKGAIRRYQFKYPGAL